MSWRLISQNFPRAMGRSGIILCLVFGSTVSLEGVAQEFDGAAASLHATAEQGDATAQYELGVMYATGEGVAQDYGEAVRWFRAAAEQGDAGAQYNLGLMYLEGLGVKPDNVEAYAWIRAAAAQGKGGTLEIRQTLLREMTTSQEDRAIRLAREYREKYVTR
jgi:hypothetical protein